MIIYIPMNQKEKAIEWCSTHISAPYVPKHIAMSSGPGWQVYWGGLAQWCVQLENEHDELMFRLSL